VSGSFKLVKPWKNGASGGYVTIWNPNPELGHPPAQRVHCEQGDFTLQGADGEDLGEHVVVTADGASIETSTDYETVFIASETEEEAMERIEETFLMQDKIVDAAARGVVRGLVIVGPPGIGKSFGVTKQLEAASMFQTLAGKDPLFEILSGGVSPIGLYKKLYFNRAKGLTLVLDDSDGVLFEEESLSLLKAALNSGDSRRICWNKESRALEGEDIPNAFDFEASIIFLSNIDFERTAAGTSRIAKHLGAILSRCHYLDLEIGSTRDKLLRIKQVIRQGMLEPYDFTKAQENEIVDFIMHNSEYLREISLRMVKKIADLVKSDPHEWQALVEATCLTRDAKFKRLMAKREAAKLKGVELAERL